MLTWVFFVRFLFISKCNMIHRRHSSDQKKEEMDFGWSFDLALCLTRDTDPTKKRRKDFLRLRLCLFCGIYFTILMNWPKDTHPQLHRHRALIRPKKEKNRVSKSRLMCSFYLNFFFKSIVLTFYEWSHTYSTCWIFARKK